MIQKHGAPCKLVTTRNSDWHKPPNQKTEVWYGPDTIVKRQLKIITKAKVSVDYCHSSESPSILVNFKPFMEVIRQLQRKGVKQRYITEITNDNIKHCEELAKYFEMRHLDSVKGTLGIIDGKIYGAIANTREGHLPTEFIYSDVKAFVDQQQYFFDTLWNKAMPAENKIREIEDGIVPETVQTLTDLLEIQELATKLACSAKKELLMVFPSSYEYHRQQNEHNGFLKKMALHTTRPSHPPHTDCQSPNALSIRIAVPNSNAAEKLQEPVMPATQEDNAWQRNVRTEVRYVDSALSTNVVVIIVDRERSLVIEESQEPSADYQHNEPRLHNRTVSRKEVAHKKRQGLAIYTNSRALVMSTVSMFELLWTHIELYEELKLRDIERREFIDIAAHELRGPIQPILGLAKEIRARYDLGKDDKMLSAILKSADNLHKLANNILDVARIESNSLRLHYSKFDINALARTTVNEFKSELKSKPELKISQKSSHKRLVISADKSRIRQVIYNLISNAIKFTDTGAISITIDKIDKLLVFSIRDTGHGIPGIIVPTLFGKFSTIPSQGGTGLGLYIAKEIVTAHGGTISGYNNSSRASADGATFTFTLPI